MDRTGYFKLYSTSDLKQSGMITRSVWFMPEHLRSDQFKLGSAKTIQVQLGSSQSTKVQVKIRLSSNRFTQGQIKTS